MFEISRTVRFCIGGSGGERAQSERVHNSFAGWPSMAGLGAHYELEVRCRGEADPVTGYLLNISAIDSAVRKRGIPLIEKAFRNQTNTTPANLLPQLASAVQESLSVSIASIRWHLTPYHAVMLKTDVPNYVLMTQQFEFSASHRLHVPQWSVERNREIFGKCNNPNGHGHNYRIEIAVKTPIEVAHSLRLCDLEAIVDRTVIQRFDHKHLNLDTTDFADLNPSVENIAKVCYELLATPIAEATGRLEYVTVWETPKTSCRFPADAAE